MKFYYKMERKFGKYAIENLMFYIALLYAMGVILIWVNPMIYFQYLSLDPGAILHGQIWRLVTFMMWPPSTDIILSALVIYCYYNLGSTLERIWGAFRFNFYFFSGVLGHVIAAFLIYFILGISVPLTANYLHLSILLAFCASFPDTQFYIYFVLPIKAKWLGIFSAIPMVYGLLFGSFVSRIEIFCSMLNFLVFFFMTKGVNPRTVIRRQQFEKKMTQATQEQKMNGHHRCCVCGRTDVDNPSLVFRFCSKCEGDYEYCQDHLYTHQHVTRGGMDPRQAESNLANPNQR